MSVCEALHPPQCLQSQHEESDIPINLHIYNSQVLACQNILFI